MMWAAGVLLIWGIVAAILGAVALAALPWPLFAMWLLVFIFGHAVAALILWPVEA